MVKLLELRAAEFAAEAELMLSGGVGDDIGEMCGDIFAAFRRREADLIKSGDRKIWRSGKIEAVVKIQSITGKIEPGVEVVEDLAKIIHSGEQLVGNFRRQRGIPRHRVVRHVNGRNLVVILQFGCGLRKRRASDGGDLISLTHKIVEGDGVLVVELVIELGETIVA